MSTGTRYGGRWRVKESNAITSRLREGQCKIRQESYQGIQLCYMYMYKGSPFLSALLSRFTGAFKVIARLVYLTCSTMKRFHAVQQRMAMLWTYLHVSWIRQGYMRSKVFLMSQGRSCDRVVKSCNPLFYSACNTNEMSYLTGKLVRLVRNCLSYMAQWVM